MLVQGIKKMKKSRMVFDETTQVSMFPKPSRAQTFLLAAMEVVLRLAVYM